ncbi:MAG: SUMF1/EgtB/PvdO family nonheme iron enzyme [Magnetococcales bacterium]|nr:SUMF1/EgtB/PvdO family nonheme iron enzyme [Magnetococcales bacterium]
MLKPKYWVGVVGVMCALWVASTSSAAGLSEEETRMAGPFVRVPAGCFQMGGGSHYDEKPIHEVCVSAFDIGKYEVTQGQWKAVMGTDPPVYDACGDHCPVKSVSWDDAQAFIRKLNAQQGGGYRLPTEAEWEYACRSGGSRLEKYCGGEDVDNLAWYDGNSGGRIHPVGQKGANGLGIYDMSGNVWEWVSDWYDGYYYENSPRENPQGASDGFFRVVRGGSWRNCRESARYHNRYVNDPGDRRNDLGFRLAKSFPPH